VIYNGTALVTLASVSLLQPTKMVHHVNHAWITVMLVRVTKIVLPVLVLRCGILLLRHVLMLVVVLVSLEHLPIVKTVSITVTHVQALSIAKHVLVI